jgi:hypothetical protein
MTISPENPRSIGAFLAVIAAAVWIGGCASQGLPSLETRMALQNAEGMTGRLRVSIRGPERRGHATILFGFRRPDALRIEIPGGGGVRLVVVTREGRLCAVFHSEHAVFRAPATAESVAAALTIALTPEEVMDMIAGKPPARLADRRVKWGKSCPREVSARLPDETRLKIKLEDIEATAPDPTAFLDPAPPGFRTIDAREARSLWEKG